MLIATESMAREFWLGHAKAAEKQQVIAAALYDLWEQTYYCKYPNTGWQRRNAEGVWEEMPERPPPQPEETPNIPYTEESIREYLKDSYWLDKVDIEDILEHLDWNGLYAYDGEELMYYWKDACFGFSFSDSRENPETEAELIFEMAVGGPNAHLVYTYKIDEMLPYPNISNGLIKAEFQYHWWSRAFTIDLKDYPKDGDSDDILMWIGAGECLDQIYESAYDNYERI